MRDHGDLDTAVRIAAENTATLINKQAIKNAANTAKISGKTPASVKTITSHIRTLKDVLDDLALKEPRFLDSIPVRRAFVKQLTKTFIAKKYDLPSTDRVQALLTDYPNANFGDVVAIGIGDPNSPVFPAPSFLDTFGFGAHGLHLGDTNPVSVFDLGSDHIKIPGGIYNTDGTLNKRAANLTQFHWSRYQHPRIDVNGPSKKAWERLAQKP